MQIARVRCLLVAAIAIGLAATAAADTGVLVLRDGLQSEYAFCREDEWGGWGKRHPAIAMFRAGLLDHAHRFAHYLDASPRLRVTALDLEAHRGDLPLRRVGLVVLDDVRATVVAPVAQQLIDFVEKGGGLIVVGGFHGFGGHAPNARFSVTKRSSDYRTSGLARILPLEVTASPDTVVARKPKITFEPGHPLGTGLRPAAWPLHAYHATRTRTTTQVLATIDGKPLVALHAVGAGRVVAFTGSELEVAYTRWKADPWPDTAHFWQRMAALALGVLDVKIQLHAFGAKGTKPTLQATLANAGARRRTVRVTAWLHDALGIRHELPTPGALRLPPGQPVLWPIALPLGDAAPGPCRVVVQAADPRRPGAVCATGIGLTIATPFADQLTASLHVPDSVRRGTDVAGTVQLKATALAKPLRLRLLKGRRALASLDVFPGTTRFRLATAPLRGGAYILELRGARPVLAKRIHVADYDPHFQNLLWWGQGDFPDGSEMRRRMVADLISHRVGAGAPADLCERHGMWAMHSLHGIAALSRFAKAKATPRSQWLDATGKRRGKLCFNDPLFADALPRWAASLAPKLKARHALGILHIEDEAACPDCYCEDCCRLFKAKYGYEMPTPTKGVKPTQAVLDRWTDRMDFKLDTFARYHKAVHDAFKKHLPNATVLTSLPQGFTVMCGEAVLPHQRHLDAFWEHTYPGTEPLGAAMAAHRVEMAAALLGVPDRPFIHLLQGFDAIDRAPKMPPREYIRLISWMALAHGADHLGWFVYRWMWWHMPGTEAWEACREVAEQLDRYAPALERLRPIRHPIGLLYPLSQECADYLTMQTATDADLPQRAVWVWRTCHSTEDAYFALKFAGVPFEPVYEEGAMAGKLPYRAIVIPHADYLRKETRAALTKFIADGGTVFLGASSTLDLPGATTLPMDFLTLFNTYFPASGKKDWQKGRIRCCWIDAVLKKAAALKTTLAPFHDRPVTVSEPEAVWSLRQGGDVCYLFVLNDKTTNPITPTQRDRRAKYAHFVIMPMAYHPVDARVSVKTAGPVYDLFRQRRVARPDRDDRAQFEAKLDGGGVGLYAVLPERIRAVKLTVGDRVTAGEPLAYHIGVWGKERLINGVVPLALTLEAGDERRTLHVATTAGECEGTLPTDLELPPGPARLTATELVSGETTRARLTILPASPALSASE